MHSLEQMLADYPFLSFVKYSHTDYIGVIQNHDGDIVSVYAFNKLRTDEDKREFLEQAETWWWESNRQIPINIFLKEERNPFKPFLRTFNNKNLVILHGPIVSLNELNKRRSKRRSITLVKRMP